ncbi:MAG: hypothetical protein QGH50_20115 [SAR324 cluster bacterium]|nr:hypothetical protein [SAR324 cluster bacterium]MDP7501740.1 hypothetical protein [SAR324 cluster bacterium]
MYSRVVIREVLEPRFESSQPNGSTADWQFKALWSMLRSVRFFQKPKTSGNDESRPSHVQ